ncbi:major facilitator superfamily domain-containing protein [Syncephalis fuscata]|nr:major facilitator superfamily domain-containing protein [Syncephalis fuscata]
MARRKQNKKKSNSNGRVKNQKTPSIPVPVPSTEREQEQEHSGTVNVSPITSNADSLGQVVVKETSNYDDSPLVSNETSPLLSRPISISSTSAATEATEVAPPPSTPPSPSPPPKERALYPINMNAPLKYKLVALICSLLMAFGSHFAAHTLGTLKGKVKEELHISNSQYGVLQSSVAIVNTVLPMVAGFFVDTFGTQIGSVLATSLIASGYVLAAFSTNIASFPIMVIGYVLYGLGSGSVTVVQGTILSHWFRGKGLAIAMGMEIATSRLASYLSMATVVSIAQWTGFYGWAFWFAALLCVLSWTVNLGYVLFIRYLHEEVGVEREQLAKKKAFHPRNLLYFPITFWCIIGMIFTLGSCWTIFLHFNTEMVKLRFGHNDEASARYLHDFYGRRATTAIVSTLLFIGSMLLFLWWPELSPMVGMLVFSISLTIGPVAIFSSVPLVLASTAVGTGLGVYKSVLHMGVSLLDIVAGILQDRASHHSNTPQPVHDEYSPVLTFCAIIGGIGFLFALGVWWTDPQHVLQKGRSNSENESIYSPPNPLETESPSDESPLLPSTTSTPSSSSPLPPVKWYSWIAVTLLVIALLSSWILFVLKLIHPKE